MLNHLKVYLRENPQRKIVKVIRSGADMVEFVFDRGEPQKVYGKKLMGDACKLLQPLMTKDTEQVAKW